MTLLYRYRRLTGETVFLVIQSFKKSTKNHKQKHDATNMKI